MAGRVLGRAEGPKFGVLKTLLLGRVGALPVGLRRVRNRCIKNGIPSLFTGNTSLACYSCSRERVTLGPQRRRTSAWLFLVIRILERVLGGDAGLTRGLVGRDANDVVGRLMQVILSYHFRRFVDALSRRPLARTSAAHREGERCTTCA
jgi:hypothetical protein